MGKVIARKSISPCKCKKCSRNVGAFKLLSENVRLISNDCWDRLRLRAMIRNKQLQMMTIKNGLLGSSIGQHGKEIADMKKRVEELTEENGKLTRNVALLSKLDKKLSQQIHANEELMTENEDLKLKLKKKINELQQKSRKEKSELKTLQNENAALKANIAELQEALEGMKQKYGLREDEKNKQISENESLKAQLQEVSKKRSELEKKNIRLDEDNQELERLIEKYSSSEKELACQLEKLKKKFSEECYKNKLLNEKNIELRNVIKENEDNLMKVKNELKDLNEEKKHRSSEIKQLELCNKNLQKELDSKNAIIDDFSEVRQDSTDTSHSNMLYQMVIQRDVYNQNLQREIASLKNTISNKNVKISELTMSNNLISDTNKSNKEEITNIRSELSAKDSMINKLKNENKQLLENQLKDY